ncbi:hypothetical protein BDZ94DRAFT_1237920 [Collybia nuda]|uniref:DUF6534 domain-containing protein n=1 Tax=Collybia nuda TaxID=64659 RepID=A0A9P5Y1U8_9AGAR|nr:hypothetical protein BDZ94DRAFT_1237920 [Collybia nuda]
MSSGITPSHAFSPVLIGLVIGAMFGGITIVQVMTFARNSRNDPFGQKLTVWVLCLSSRVLDVLHISFTVHMIYYYLVSHPSNTSTIWSFPRPIDFVADVYYANFALLLIPLEGIFQWFWINWYLFICIVKAVLVSANLAAGVYVTIRVFQCPNLQDVKDFQGQAPLIDLLIPVSLCCALTKAGTNLHWTNSTFTMLLAYFVNTGAIVSLCSTSVLISFLLSKKSLIFIGIETVSTRLDKTLQRLSRTINEVGLPLFQSSAKSENSAQTPSFNLTQDIKMVEVMVRKEARSDSN